MFVSGITSSNRTAKLAEAQSNLENGIRSGASDTDLALLSKRVGDVSATIKAMDARAAKKAQKELEQYNEMNAWQKRIVDNQKEIAEKEQQERNDAWDSIHEKITGVGESIAKGLNTFADSAFHSMLGPFRAIIDPLEKQFGFNLFNKTKDAVSFLNQKVNPSRTEIVKKGGLIGACATFIANTLSGNKDAETGDVSSEGGLLSKLTGAIDLKSLGISPTSLLKYTGIAALVAGAAVLTGKAILDGWDQDGPQEAQKLKDVWSSESSTWWDKTKASVVFAVKAVFGTIAGFFRGFWNGIKNWWASVSSVWSDDSLNVFQKIGLTILNTITGVFNTLWSGIKNAWASLTGYILPLFNTDWESVKAWFSEKWQAVVNWFAGVGTSIANWWSGIVTNITTWWGNVKTFVSGCWTAAKASVSNTWSSITNWFTEKWNSVKTWWEGVKTSISGIWTSITGWFGSIGTTISTYWTNAKIAVATTWSNITTWFSSKWTAIGTWITEKKTAISDFITGIKDKIAGIFSSIGGFFSNIWTSITDKFSEIFNVDMGAWFTNAKDSITSVVTSLFDKITGAVSGVVGSITGFFKDIGTLIGNLVKHPIKTVSAITSQGFGEYFESIGEARKAEEAKVVSVNDAIIAKDNTYYIPSKDDNIIASKGEISIGKNEGTTSSEFQSRLLTTLSRMEALLEKYEPSIITTNVSGSSGINFEALRA